MECVSEVDSFVRGRISSWAGGEKIAPQLVLHFSDSLTVRRRFNVQVNWWLHSLCAVEHSKLCAEESGAAKAEGGNGKGDGGTPAAKESKTPTGCRRSQIIPDKK